MEADARTLRQLIGDSMYVVDERAVADAIMLRARLRTTIARPTLQNEQRDAGQPSLRRDPRARLLGLVRGPSLGLPRR